LALEENPLKLLKEFGLVEKSFEIMKKKMPEKFEMWKKATANKPKPKPLKLMILMKTWMVNTISKQIGLIKNTLFRVFFFKNINPRLKYLVPCNILAI
jgi:hypothetical protein